MLSLAHRQRRLGVRAGVGGAAALALLDLMLRTTNAQRLLARRMIGPVATAVAVIVVRVATVALAVAGRRRGMRSITAVCASSIVTTLITIISLRASISLVVALIATVVLIIRPALVATTPAHAQLAHGTRHLVLAIVIVVVTIGGAASSLRLSDIINLATSVRIGIARVASIVVAVVLVRCRATIALCGLGTSLLFFVLSLASSSLRLAVAILCIVVVVIARLLLLPRVPAVAVVVSPLGRMASLGIAVPPALARLRIILVAIMRARNHGLRVAIAIGGTVGIKRCCRDFVEREGRHGCGGRTSGSAGAAAARLVV